jgi:hypothetical protein
VGEEVKPSITEMNLEFAEDQIQELQAKLAAAELRAEAATEIAHARGEDCNQVYGENARLREALEVGLDAVTQLIDQGGLLPGEIDTFEEKARAALEKSGEGTRPRRIWVERGYDNGRMDNQIMTGPPLDPDDFIEFIEVARAES